MPTDCVTVGNCTDCPAIEAVVGVPAHYDNETRFGWDAGANSVIMLDGDLHVVFHVAAGILGMVVGFKALRFMPTQPALVAYGLYFTMVNGSNKVLVQEMGVTLTSAVSYGDGDQFEIRRSGGVVTYWHGATKLYTSNVRSDGALLVNACLYASGDGVT
jgi:hypothetical protein